MSMVRTVSSRVTSKVSEPAEIVFSVAVAHGPRIENERISATVDGTPVEFEEVAAEDGGRLHVVRDCPVGNLQFDYAAKTVGWAEPAATSALQQIVYLRPSRYSDSDVLAPTARDEFRSRDTRQLMEDVTSWVGTQLAYVSGWSRPTDGAVETLLARQGVCRDFAHLVVGLLRARGVPARLVSVYAPGLSPMDFHAVAEAYLDGGWYVLDATSLAPRQSMLRIATGRDAADTAFMTVHSGRVDLTGVRVGAVVDPDLPRDHSHLLVSLG